MYNDYENNERKGQGDGWNNEYTYNYANHSDGDNSMQPLYVNRPEKAPEEPPKKKKGAGLRLAALAVACAVVGGLGGGALVGTYYNSKSGSGKEQEAVPTAAEDTLLENAQTQDSGTKNADAGTSGSSLVVATNSSKQVLTPTEVYNKNKDAVVGIANETGTNIFGQASSTASTGTGFIISSDGYIITNYHVIENAKILTVTLSDGTAYRAEVIGGDEVNDTALIKVDAVNLPFVTIGDSDSLQVGEMVMAIGNPLGELTLTLTVGYVSALDREINTDGQPINMLQTDAAINPGNSGGPLFDQYGNVIGITTAKSSGTDIEGLGFAIPINDAVAVVQELKEYGYVTGRPSIGIKVQDVNIAQATYNNVPVGVYVAEVEQASAAQNAGVLDGDIITKMGGESVKTTTELASVKKKFSAGDTTTIEVYRLGETLELTITFDEQKPAAEEPVQQQNTSQPDFYDYFFGGTPNSESGSAA